jgi:hypothetical protein
MTALAVTVKEQAAQIQKVNDKVELGAGAANGSNNQ